MQIGFLKSLEIFIYNLYNLLYEELKGKIKFSYLKYFYHNIFLFFYSPKGFSFTLQQIF